MFTADGGGTKTDGPFTYDPYGQSLNGLPNNSSGDFDYGYLGGHKRGTEHIGSLNTIEMGARQYVPGLGRFLSVDPIDGGSANAYEYVNGDPVNGRDLEGLRRHGPRVLSVYSHLGQTPGGSIRFQVSVGAPYKVQQGFLKYRLYFNGALVRSNTLIPRSFSGDGNGVIVSETVSCRAGTWTLRAEAQRGKEYDSDTSVAVVACPSKKTSRALLRVPSISIPTIPATR